MLKLFSKALTPALVVCFLAWSIQGCVGGKTKQDTKARPTAVSREAKAASAADKAQAEVYAGFDQLARQDYKLALGAMANNQFNVAERLLDPLAQKYPEYSPLQTNLAIIYFNTGRLDRAYEGFQEAVKRNSRDVVAYNYLGILHRQKGEFGKAMEYYKQALAVNPDYPNALLNAGILYDLYLGDKDKALASYERYQELTKGEDKEVGKWILDLRRQM